MEGGGRGLAVGWFVAGRHGGKRRSSAGGDGAEEGEGLEGFAEAHFVREDATELVTVQVPEPSGAEALVGTEEGVEGGRDGCGGEGGEVFQGAAAGAPRLG